MARKKIKVAKYLGGAGGGVIGNILTTQLEANIPQIATNENIAPAITAVLGLAVESMVKNEVAKSAGFGAFCVSAAELGKNAIDATGLMGGAVNMPPMDSGAINGGERQTVYNKVI